MGKSDAMLGPMYAVFTGLVNPASLHAQWMLEVNAAQLNRSAISESQPYYSRHPEIHLLRGERERFLNAFYSGLTALADRETFSFWEHLYQVSIHKTHEEGWALMQLRRMLWVENGNALHLLSGVPVKWFQEALSVTDGASYFGHFSFSLKPEGDHLVFHWEPRLHTDAMRLLVYFPDSSFSTSKQERIRFEDNGVMEILQPDQPLRICLERSPL